MLYVKGLTYSLKKDYAYLRIDFEIWLYAALMMHNCK